MDAGHPGPPPEGPALTHVRWPWKDVAGPTDSAPRLEDEAALRGDGGDGGDGGPSPPKGPEAILSPQQEGPAPAPQARPSPPHTLDSPAAPRPGMFCAGACPELFNRAAGVARVTGTSCVSDSSSPLPWLCPGACAPGRVGAELSPPEKEAPRSPAGPGEQQPPDVPLKCRGRAQVPGRAGQRRSPQGRAHPATLKAVDRLPVTNPGLTPVSLALAPCTVRRRASGWSPPPPGGLSRPGTVSASVPQGQGPAPGAGTRGRGGDRHLPPFICRKPRTHAEHWHLEAKARASVELTPGTGRASMGPHPSPQSRPPTSCCDANLMRYLILGSLRGPCQGRPRIQPVSTCGPPGLMPLPASGQLDASPGPTREAAFRSGGPRAPTGTRGSLLPWRRVDGRPPHLALLRGSRAQQVAAGAPHTLRTNTRVARVLGSQALRGGRLGPSCP
ncbi:hypothetical protein VULLAG_LOCUS13871 [Vulpes lagopus]